MAKSRPHDRDPAPAARSPAHPRPLADTTFLRGRARAPNPLPSGSAERLRCALALRRGRLRWGPPLRALRAFWLVRRSDARTLLPRVPRAR